MPSLSPLVLCSYVELVLEDHWCPQMKFCQDLLNLAQENIHINKYKHHLSEIYTKITHNA